VRNAVRRLAARFVLWLCDDACEAVGHFNIHPDGYPGCISNWRWKGYGPNRWLGWALDVLPPDSPDA
jgi:hypothetical protein